MSKQYYALLYIIIAFIVIHYFIRSLSKKDELGKLMQAFLFFAILVVISYTLTLLTNNPFTISLGNSIMFASIDYLLYCIIEYAIHYTQIKVRYLNINTIFKIFIPLDTLVLLSNPWTNIALDYHQVFQNNSVYLLYQPKLWFEIHLIACYLMTLVFIIIFVYKILKTPKVYQIKYSMILFFFLGIVIGNALVMLMQYRIDFSILGYGIAAIGFFFFTYDYSPTQLINNASTLIVQNMHNGVFLFDFEHKLVTCNAIARKIYPVKESDFQTINLTDFVLSNGLSLIIEDNGHQCIEVTKMINDEQKWYQVDFQNMFDKDGKYIGSLILLQDDTDRNLNIKQMEYMATHDYLTDLYNRNYYLAIQNKLTHKTNYPISFVCWNINGLKVINNIYGNVQGDAAFKQVANTIREQVLDPQCVFRFDGDEIVVILYNTSEEEALAEMSAIQQQIEMITILDIQVTAEFGISTILNNETSLDEAYNKAKTAMTHRKMLNQKSLRSNIIESLKKSLQENNYDTEEHAVRTSQTAVQLGKQIGLSDSSLKELELLAMLHDIGKLSIPDYILNKPSKLTEEEFEMIKLHTVKGFEIARITPELANIAEGILHHHERWDGKGYPNGLKGEEIPLLSRIIAIVDSHDVMTHDRVYHKAMSAQEAIAELKRCSGTQFDPHLIEKFLPLLPQNEKKSAS